MQGTNTRTLWIENLSGLVGGVQMNTLEFHVWGSDRHMPDVPELKIFDIDPDEGLDFSHVRKAATGIKDILVALGLQAWPLVSGSKGVHLVGPLIAQAEWDAAKWFCHNFAKRWKPRREVSMSLTRRGVAELGDAGAQGYRTGFMMNKRGLITSPRL